MKTIHKNVKWSAFLLAVCMLLSFCACAGGGDVADTTLTDALTDPATGEAVTVTVTGTDATETQASADTTGETSADTTAGTEAETQVEEIVLPDDAPTKNNVVTFCDFSKNDELFSGKAYTAEIVKDEDASVIKLTTDGDNVRGNYFRLDYAAYMNYAKLDPVAWENCGYVIVTLKVENVSDTAFEIILKGEQGESSFQAKGQATYSKTNKGWQTLAIPVELSEKEGATLSEMRIFFAKNASAAGETVYIKSVALTSDKLEMMELMGKEVIKPSTATVTIPGLTKEYTFLQITDTHVSAFSDADVASWATTRYNYNVARRNAFAADGLLAEERFPWLFDYADQIGADATFLTGDLIDFPSEKNIAMLYENATRVKAEPIFCLGNHDWTYADDYMTQNAKDTYLPRFTELTGGDPYLSVKEYDEFIVAAIDNSSDVVTQATVDKFFALYEKNKPIILLLHVPLHVDTLEADVRKTWGDRNITMGIGAMGSDWQSVIDFYTSVCLDEDTPVVAVFAGHVHFNHEDTFPNGVPQYVTSTGYTGDCRIITVTGEEN